MTEPTPPTWPPTADELVAVKGAGAESDRALRELALSAALDYVERLGWVRRILDAGGVPGGGVRLGTLLLAARYVERRNSLGGVLTSPEGGVAYIARHDPDVATMLGLGRPRVG